APCSKPFSITNPISRARPSTASNANHNRGGPANTDRSNRRSRSPSWLLRFISPTSCGSQLFTSSSSQYRSCSCSRVDFFMFVYLRWPLAGQRSVLAAHGRAPQFPRDKLQIVEEKGAHASELS